MTDEQRYRISQNINVLPEALHRDPSVDYTEGVFHVTLNVRERYSVLGKIDVQNKTIDLTDIGCAVEQCWQQIPRFYPNVELIEHQVMPEHFHGSTNIGDVRCDQSRMGKAILCSTQMVNQRWKTFPT